MDETTQSNTEEPDPDRTASGGPSEYTPHATPVSPQAGVEAQKPSRRDLAIGLTATIATGDFDADGVMQASQEVGRDRLEDREDVVYNLLATKAEQDSGEIIDFRLLTAEVSLDEQRISTGEGGDSSSGIPNRYDVIECIGSGANGQVFAVFDNNFDREVAAKFLHPKKAAKEGALDAFMREAKLTASLAHPNILPIHDVDISDGGMAYFTMRKAEGISLADAIETSREHVRPLPEIASFHSRIDILNKVCDAVAYAHERGIIHQDIKPENIMLGRHGQVMLLDWGTAITKAEREAGGYKLQGTPAYMAPEQARRAYIDERSDIYCIGASLFQLLTFRLPTWAEELDTFWDLKRQGVIQAPTADERSHIPAPLLAIAMKAMAAEPAERYASVSELRDDLRRWQEGLSVSAHSDSVGDLARRIYRRNRSAFWVGLAAAGLIGVGGWFWWQDKQQELTAWRVVAQQDFEPLLVNSLARWSNYRFEAYRESAVTVDQGEQKGWYKVEDGVLKVRVAGIGNGAYNLVWREPMPGDIRASWTVTSLRNATNFNCFISGNNRYNAYTFHVAGFGDARTLTVTREDQVIERFMLDEPMQINRPYRFMIERVGNRISLTIDNKNIVTINDPDPLIGSDHQHWGIEHGNNNLDIDNVVVERRPLPQRIPSIAVADSLFAEGHFKEALARYRGLIRHVDDADMAGQAAYRIGRCLQELGEFPAARLALRAFIAEHGEHRLLNAALLHLGSIQMELGRVEEAEQTFQRLATSPTSSHYLRRMAMLRIASHILGNVPLIGTGSELRSSGAIYLDDALEALKQFEYWAEILEISPRYITGYENLLQVMIAYRLLDEVEARITPDDYLNATIRRLRDLPIEEQTLSPSERDAKIMAALRAEGRLEELIERFGENYLLLKERLELGRYDEIRKHPYAGSWVEGSILRHQGRYDEALTHNPKDVDLLADLGRWDDIRALVHDTGFHVGLHAEGKLLDRLGETAPAIERGAKHMPNYRRAFGVEALRAMADERFDDARKHIDNLRSLPTPPQFDPLLYLIIIPSIDAALAGDIATVKQRIATIMQAPEQQYAPNTTFAAFLLEDASADTLIEMFYAMETSADSHPIRVAMLTGLRHELNGNQQAAIAAYQTAPSERPALEPSFSFIRWRLRALGIEQGPMP